MISVNFTCSNQKLAMNSCLRKYGTMDERDRAREEWFATRVQKKREAAEQEAERLKNVYAERKRLEEIEARKRAQEPETASSWWPIAGLWSKSHNSSRPDIPLEPDRNTKGKGG
jgi:Cytochrome c oxidase biogenesis protein Cmc1 like